MHVVLFSLGWGWFNNQSWVRIGANLLSPLLTRYWNKLRSWDFDKVVSFFRVFGSIAATWAKAHSHRLHASFWQYVTIWSRSINPVTSFKWLEVPLLDYLRRASHFSLNISNTRRAFALFELEWFHNIYIPCHKVFHLWYVFFLLLCLSYTKIAQSKY